MQWAISENRSALNSIENQRKLGGCDFVFLNSFHRVVVMQVHKVRLGSQMPCHGFGKLSYRNLFAGTVPQK